MTGVIQANTTARFRTELERDRRACYLAILGWDLVAQGQHREGRWPFRRTVYTLEMLAPKGRAR